MVRFEEAYRADYANLGRLRIDLPNLEGQTERGQIELRDVATIYEGVGPNSVNRENARRRIVIRCNTEGRDLASAVAEIQRRVNSEVAMPVGYYVEYGGQFESQQNATRSSFKFSMHCRLHLLAACLLLCLHSKRLQ
jgi:HME family heavy-metal exporter